MQKIKNHDKITCATYLTKSREIKSHARAFSDAVTGENSNQIFGHEISANQVLCSNQATVIIPIFFIKALPTNIFHHVKICWLPITQLYLLNEKPICITKRK